jgi:hypothetical protein
MLVVTLHRGSHTAGAVAVLQLTQPGSSGTPRPQQDSVGQQQQQQQQQQVCVELLQLISNDQSLKQPNMIAIQM